MDPIEVFVGTDRSQLLAVAVLQHSIERHTLRRVQISPLVDLDLPEPRDIRQGSRTNFSFARFAIPELMSYKGKAVYLDADMLVFRDIENLWSLPFPGQSINIQEEIPKHAISHERVGAPKRRSKQCSVMLMDCERAQWDVGKIVAGLDGDYTYDQLMYEMCILDESEVKYGVPFAWNSLEHYDLHTRLIHYTDMNTQPWVSAYNPLGKFWMREVKLMLETGALSWEQIHQDTALGYFRPSLSDELREMPHERAFDRAAADRYAAADKDAGFVKHAEVNKRKLARAAAVKAQQRSTA